MDFENCLKFSVKAIQLLGSAFSLEKFWNQLADSQKQLADFWYPKLAML